MSDKKCRVCHYSVPENAKFCPDCGAPVDEKKVKSKSSGKNTRTRDTLIIIGVLAVISIGYFVVKKPEAGPKPQVQQQQFGGNGHPEISGDPDAMSVLSNLPTDYNSLVQLGNQTMDAGNYALASECYKRALQLDGSSVNVRTDYGACLHGMGLPDRALEEFRTVLKAQPDHGIANFNMGIVFYTTQRNDSAKYYWEKYLEIDPNGSAAAQARDYLTKVS